MRIALVYDAVYPWIQGGGEKHLYELARELHLRGHEVHLFAMQYWDGPADMVREGLHYHGLCRGGPLYARSGRRRLLPPLRFAWGVLWRLPRYQPRQFDVIDVLAFPFLSVPIFWLVHRLFAGRVRWILTWLEVWGPNYWSRYLGRGGCLGARIERWCARLAPEHLCISPSVARRLHEVLGVARERIHMIPRGFSMPEGIAADAFKVPAKVVAAGRLVHNKRIDLLLRAWPMVIARLPHARLHLLGDGPERAACESLARDLSILTTVRFHGQIPRWEDVLGHIASASLLVQPSHREGQSLVVVEAMALGTPALVATGPETAAGDLLCGSPAEDLVHPPLEPETVASELLPGHADREWSLLPVEAGPEEWARRIICLLGDPPLLQRMAQQGRAQVKDLGWRDFIAPRVEKLYKGPVQ